MPQPVFSVSHRPVRCRDLRLFFRLLTYFPVTNTMVVAVTLEIYEDSKFGVPEVKGRNESQE